MKTFFDGMQIGFHTVHIHQIPETEQSKHEDWNRKPLEKEKYLQSDIINYGFKQGIF